MDTHVSFVFQEAATSKAIAAVSFKWANSAFGASDKTETFNHSSSEIKKTTATPSSVSGTLFIKK